MQKSGTAGIADTASVNPAPAALSAQLVFWVPVATVIICMVIVFTFYTRIEPVSVPGNYYALQGSAFLAGHTYVDVKAPPELLDLEDPYNPYQPRLYTLWDASFYHGKFYIYFGPVPSLLWAAVKYTTGFSLSDPALTLGFTCVATASLFVLLVLIAQHEKIASAPGLLCAGIALALGTWLPFMLRRPSIYEAAISGAYCFSALGVFFCGKACTKTSAARSGSCLQACVSAARSVAG